jgi:tetratricopeptide (TPR) repeat protein
MRTAGKILSIIIVALLVVGFGPSSLRRGRKYLEKGEYTRALEALTDALNEDPDNPEIHRDLSIAYYNTGQYEQALDELNKAKEKREKDAQVMFYLGLTYERLEQYDKAIEEYSNYVKLGRFNSMKKEIQRRVEWLIRQQAAQWAEQRMKIEEQINPASIPDNTIGVTYFKPFSVSNELVPLHKGLTELLIVDLSMVEALRVVDRTRLTEIYNELALASTDFVDQSMAPRLGKLLGANSLVTGTFTGFGDEQWRIDPTLGRIKLGKFQALEGLEGEIASFLQTEKQLVLNILISLGIELTEAEKDEILQNIPTESLEAFLAYSRGLDFTDRGMFGEAEKAFEDAISLDPAFSQARENLTGVKLLTQPVGSIGEVEAKWNSTLSAEIGKDMLMATTIQSVAQGDIDRVPVSEMSSSRAEVEVELLIQW